MIAFPFLLIGPATEAGIKIPPEETIDGQTYDPAEFPHWHVYANLQLGTPMPSPTSHWDNAKIIAAVSNEKIMLLTPAEARELGFSGI